MSDTLGGLIDKLFTVDMKMWDNQDILYKIRRMSFEEFKAEYWSSENGAQELWSVLKKACDLNMQRNQLIDEIDEKVVEMMTSAISGEELDSGKFIQRKHKNY